MPFVTVTVQLATDTAAYAAGDAVGSLVELPGMARTPGTGGVTQTVTLVEDTVQAAAATLFFFPDRITPTVNNAAFAPSDVDMRTCLGFVPVNAYPATAPANNQIATTPNAGLAYQCKAGSTSLFVQLQTNGTPTYAAFGVYLKVTTYYE